MPGDNLGCDMALMRGSVCEHWVSRDVANCIDVVYVCLALCINVNETAIVCFDPRSIGFNHRGI